MAIVTTSFSKSTVFEMFSVHTKTKNPAFSNSSGLKSALEKFRFRDGLVWTVGLTIKITLRFFKFFWRSEDGSLVNEHLCTIRGPGVGPGKIELNY